MTPTGGHWDPAAWPKYFIASSMTGGLWQAREVNKSMLIAVNELKLADDIEKLHELLDLGIDVFIDSGVFNLSTQHAKTHNLTMDQALGLAPSDVDGFDDLFDRYVRLIRPIEDRVWGYIEIDQGGRENKIRTRARLESIGLRPIPVYHPFNDGWDYFDYLAENYDRICVGNVVQADPATRKRLVATAYQRRRRYPNLWIHLLGLTPSTLTVAFPPNSCDSSTWLSAVRWGVSHATVATARVWETSTGLNSDQTVDGHHARGHHAARRMAGWDAGMVNRTMTAIAADQVRALGCDIGMFAR